MIDIKKQALMEGVADIPLEENFSVPKGFIIPLKNKVIVKKEIGNKDPQTTEAGILLVDTMATNTVIPHVGIVYAVGPEVSDFLFPGLKVMYNPYADFEIMISGIPYLRMDEHDVFGILPPKSHVYNGVKSEDHLRREKRIMEFHNYYINKDKKEANDLDKQEELAKKKK